MSTSEREVAPAVKRGATSGRRRPPIPPALSFLGRLVVRLVLTLFGLLTLLFFLVRLSGDPAAVLAGPGATGEDLAALRTKMGLDEPLWTQYVAFLGDVVRLDFGTSIFSGREALPAVLDALPATMMLITATLVVAVALGVPAGLALVRAPGWVRRALGGLLTLGQAVPAFLIGIGLIAFLAVRLGWLPSYGSGSVQQLVMPVLALSFFTVARTARMLAAELEELDDADFLRTARAKGASRARELWRHALPNATPPVISALVVEFSYLLSGAVVVEVLFAYSGIGKLLVDAIFQRDYAIVQASVFVIGVVVVLVNVVGDLLLRVVDPRTTRSAA